MDDSLPLYLLKEGKLRLMDNKVDEAEIYSGWGVTVFLTNQDGSFQILNIVNDNLGYIKAFDKNILESISVDDNLADFKSYLNPRVWFGGPRHTQSNKVYQVRSTDKINDIAESIEKDGEEFFKNRYLQHVQISGKFVVFK